jgi:PKD repeat protein
MVNEMKSTQVLLLAVFVFILVCVNPSTAAVPVANFSGDPTTGVVPLTVQFFDNSTGFPTGWAWYFGDENYTAPWTQVTVGDGLSVRMTHRTVVMPDGSIILMGGYVGFPQGTPLNDVWRSTDNGATWTQMTANAGWSVRVGFSSVAMPDGSIVLMGGFETNNGSKPTNDVWRSTDNGATWTQMTANAGWSARAGHSSVAMPDGSIVLIGGYTSTFEVWRLSTRGSSAQNPSHTYTKLGTYLVGLQAYNSHGYNSTRKVGYITATTAATTGVYRPGLGFFLKMDNGSTWNWFTDKYLGWDKAVIDLPVAGDWNADGHTETGVYRPGVGFFLKMDNTGTWTPSTDTYLGWDNAVSDLPVAGDWNADGRTETGVYRPGAGFYLKMDNGSTWNPSTDVYLAWDNAGIDLPVAGDWNADGRTETGVYRPGAGFYLKMDSTGTWNPSTDKYLAWDNAVGDLPIAGNFV